jgi:hypothetical protein
MFCFVRGEIKILNEKRKKKDERSRKTALVRVFCCILYPASLLDEGGDSGLA